MGRELAHPVLVGGVVHPAGTRETRELAARIGDDHWVEAAPEVFVPVDHPNTVALRAIVEDAATEHAADLDAPLGEVFADVLGRYDVDLPDTSTDSEQTSIAAAADLIDHPEALGVLRGFVLSAGEFVLRDPDRDLGEVFTEAAQVVGVDLGQPPQTGAKPSTGTSDASGATADGGSDGDGTPAGADEVAETGSHDGDPDAVDYSSWSKGQLETEVEKRNASRDPADETQIRPAGRNKPEFVEALAADDARLAGTTQKG